MKKSHAVACALVLPVLAIASTGVANAAPAPGQPPVPYTSTRPAATAVDATADFNNAVALVANNFGLASGVGALAGGVVTAVAGCGIGAVTAGLTFATTVVLTPLAALAGCLTGAALLATFGPIIGGAILGVPVGLASLAQAYNTLHAAGEVAQHVHTADRHGR